MPVNVVLGEQRGDEGKGRYVDMLMPEHEIGARFNGGANAGHTIVCDNGEGEEEVYKVHGLPSSIIHPHAKSVMGPGVVIDAIRLCKEIDTLQNQGVEISPNNLLISSAAKLILPTDVSADEIREAGKGGQGSTKSGIAQAYAAKAMREGLQASDFKHGLHYIADAIVEGLNDQADDREDYDLPTINPNAAAREYLAAAQRLGDFVTDTTIFLHRELRKPNPAHVLAEGAQATLLDIDHGMYPFTTSSTTTIGGVMTGLGIPPQFIDRTLGVIKAMPSHVGGGPFLTEITDQDYLDQLHGDKSTVDAEVGTTTGRTRRLGFLDLVQVKRAQMINGTTEIGLTKVDWVPRYGDEIPICVGYSRKGKNYDLGVDAAYKYDECTPQYVNLKTWKEDISDVRSFDDLPRNAKRYLNFIERVLRRPITYIGVGPGRDQVIVKK